MKQIKETKLSVNKMDKIIHSQAAPDEVVIYHIDGEDDISIKVKKSISLIDCAKFTIEVTNDVFQVDEDTNTTLFLPSYYEFSFNKAVLKYFTNVKTDIDDDHLNQFLIATDIIPEVTSRINRSQIESLIASCTEAVQYKRSELLNSKTDLLNKNYDELQNATQSFVKIADMYKNVEIEEILPILKSISTLEKQDLVDNVLAFRDSQDNVDAVSEDASSTTE